MWYACVRSSSHLVWQSSHVETLFCCSCWLRASGFSRIARDSAALSNCSADLLRSQEELVSSLQVENQALQAAVERLRHDFQEERTLRLKREKKSGSAAAAAAANQTAPPSTPARGDGDESGRLGIMGRRRLSSRNSLPATASAAGTAARHPKTPTRSSGILSGPGVHNHNVRSTPHRARSSGGVGAAAEAAAAAAAVAAGWESNHGGIGSRHSVPTMSLVESWTVANEEGEGLPWILNTDQVRAGVQSFDRCLFLHCKSLFGCFGTPVPPCKRSSCYCQRLLLFLAFVFVNVTRIQYFRLCFYVSLKPGRPCSFVHVERAKNPYHSRHPSIRPPSVSPPPPPSRG